MHGRSWGAGGCTCDSISETMDEMSAEVSSSSTAVDAGGSQVTVAVVRVRDERSLKVVEGCCAEH